MVKIATKCHSPPPTLTQVDEHAKVAQLGSALIREGDCVSLNGTTGEVIRGAQPLSPPRIADHLEEFMSWVGAFK